MQLIDIFHKMESECKLFDLGKEINLPVWDIVRYSVYVKYYYPPEDRKRLSNVISHSVSDYFRLIYLALQFFFKVSVCKGENIILTASRYTNAQGEYFDKSAIAIIDELGENCLTVEPIRGKKVAYRYIYDFSLVLRRLLLIYPKISLDDFKAINDALIKHFGENRITYVELNEALRTFYAQYYFFKILFKLKKTKKLFIALGNPKATILAAQELKIKTYLLQHASIEIDEVDYSYPSEITLNSRILFPHYVLTFGDYWCRDINVPAEKIIPIGNDYFYAKPNVLGDSSILIISTIVHGRELSLLTKQLAQIHQDISFVFKLHPNEFHFYKDYIDFFKFNPNVLVVTNQTDTNVLIAKAQLIVLIVSAVLYEALNQNKKIAIYKRINFARNTSFASFPNVYLFDHPNEISDILLKEVLMSEVNFYKPTDHSLIKTLSA